MRGAYVFEGTYVSDVSDPSRWVLNKSAHWGVGVGRRGEMPLGP